MPTLLCAETTCHAPRTSRRSLYCIDHTPATSGSSRRLVWRPARRDAAEQVLAHRAARRALEREVGDDERIGSARLLRSEAADGQLRYEFEFALAGWETIAVRKTVITRPEAALRQRRVQVSHGGQVVIRDSEHAPVPYHAATGLPGAVARALRHLDHGVV
jgi:hypothetical protein